MIVVAEHSPSRLGPSATLPETLAAWRGDRSSAALANRIDELGARVPLPPLPAKLQRWWTDAARTYDPIGASVLLATLHVQARAGNVSWRTILQRDTPLARVLGASGFAATERGEWTNLLDRIGLLLTWPDDPRVAMALARAVRHAPFQSRYRMHRGPERPLLPVVEAMVRRVIEIGDARAIARVAGFQPGIGEAASAAIRQAHAQVPSPRAIDATPVGAWSAVLDDPFDLSARLVLADAYLERGDPRGELIALQCAPFVALEAAAAAGRTVDRHGLFGVASERIAALVDQHWFRWFGELALVIGARSSLRGGLLARIHVGREVAPAWAWAHAAQHHELCAVEEILPAKRLVEEDIDTYAGFLRMLPRQPRWVHLDERALAALRGERLPFIGVRFTMGPRDPLVVAADLLAIAPQLQRLALHYHYSQHMDALHEVAATYPQLTVELRHDVY